MTLAIEFENEGQDFTLWIVNSAGYIISTEPANNHEYVGSRVTNPMRKIKEGDLLTVIKSGVTTKIKHRVLSIKYID